MSGLPAVVTILDLGTGSLSSSAMFPASMTTGGVATTLGITMQQIASAVVSATIVPVPSGGTNTSILTQNGVLYGNGSSTVGITAAGGTSLPLLGQGSGNAPAYGVLPVIGGGTNTATLTAFGVMFGNGTSTVGITASGNTALVLLSPGNLTGPVFGQVSLTAAVTGVLPLVNGGTQTSTVFTQGAAVFAGTSGIYNQDAANFWWDQANRRLGIGINAPTVPLTVSLNATTGIPARAGAGQTIHLVGVDGSNNFQVSDSFGALGNFIYRRADGTAGGPSSLVSGDNMGAVSWRGYAGAAYLGTNSARIAGVAIENWNATSAGAALTFETTAVGSTTASTERMRVIQGVAVGTSTDPGSGNFYASNYLNSGGFTRVATANFTAPASSTTFVDITGLSAALLTGNTYGFEACLYATAGSTGGTKIQVACTGTATQIVYDAQVYAAAVLVTQARATGLTGPVPATSAVTPTFRVVGTITAANSGNMTMQVAQVAATTTSTVILGGSTLKVFQIS